MTELAIKRLDAARHVLAAQEAGEFSRIGAAAAWARGFDLETADAWFYEWPGGQAIGNTRTGRIEVSLADAPGLFLLDPATGAVEFP